MVAGPFNRTLRDALAASARLARVGGSPGAPASRDAHTVDALTAWVALRVVDADSEETLDDAIAALAEDPELHRRVQAIPAAALLVPMEHAAARWAQLYAVFADQPEVMRGILESRAVSSCIVPVLREAGLAPESDDDPLWFVYDPSVPPEVARALLAGLYGSIAQMAVEHLAFEAHPARHKPVRRMLVRRWVEEQHWFLRLLASVPGNDVPLDVVPSSERLDLPRLGAETTAVGQWFEDVLAKAASPALEPPAA